MAAASQKKALCELWGISSSEIDDKVAILKSIIGDLPTATLLDYLSKADLNMQQCINLHFTQSAITMHDTNTNTNAHSSTHNNNKKNTSTPVSKPLQNRRNRRKKGFKARTKKSKQSEKGNDDRRKRLKARTKKTKQSKKANDSDDSDDSDYNPENDDSLHSQKRKIEFETEVHLRRSKRRRLSSVSTNATNTTHANTNTNTNTNSSSSKQERDDDDDDDDDHKEETKRQNDDKNGFLPPLESYIDNAWNRLNFGSFAFAFTPKTDTKGLRIPALTLACVEGRFKANLLDHEWFKGGKRKLQNILHTALAETSENKGELVIRAQTVNDTHSTIFFNAWESRKYKKDERYITTFTIALCKPLQSVTSDFRGVAFGAAIGICTRNEEIAAEQMQANQLCAEYRRKCGRGLTLEGLLDFGCRYKYKVTRKQRREEEEYGLAVKLYDYQLQSIRHMIAEENHKIGFYRHLYRLGFFEDDNNMKSDTLTDIKSGKSFFYYSAVFQHLIVNKHLPIVHGGLLCEEMGLGKTIEAMALINYNAASREACSTREKLIIAQQHRQRVWRLDKVGYEDIIYYKSRATLIIAPVSLVGQWEKECAQKSKHKIAMKRYYASYRKRDVREYIDEDIVFTTYGIIAKEDGSNRARHILHCIEWHRIILDESHYIKNTNTVTSRNIHELHAVNKWLLTGTPFGRQVTDIYNQLKFLGVKAEHLDSMMNLAQMKRLIRRSDVDQTAAPLLKVMQCLVMRHKKAQLFNSKPIVQMTEKQEDVMFIEFSQAQKEYYEKLYSIAKQRYEVYKATGNIGRGSIAILASLHPARQACSGHIYSKQEIEEELSKAQAKTYHVQQIVDHNGDKSPQELYDMALASAYNIGDAECPICYETPFDDPLQTICRHIYCGECIRSVLMVKPECPMCRKRCTVHQLKKPPSENSNTEKETEKMDIDKKEEKEMMIRFDTKLKRLIAEINRLKREKPADKSLIFTSFSKSLNWICDELNKNGIEYRTLTGSMTMNKRKKALQQFEADDSVKVFVLTVRSGAVGITLTAANHVFLMEPPFNPALYRQAINRVHRLGQKKKVFIQTLIMKDSIEERIWNINKNKQNIDKDCQMPMAGNISRDKSLKLQTHEISKLFV